MPRATGIFRPEKKLFRYACDCSSSYSVAVFGASLLARCSGVRPFIDSRSLTVWAAFPGTLRGPSTLEPVGLSTSAALLTASLAPCGTASRIDAVASNTKSLAALRAFVARLKGFDVVTALPRWGLSSSTRVNSGFSFLNRTGSSSAALAAFSSASRLPTPSWRPVRLPTGTFRARATFRAFASAGLINATLNAARRASASGSTVSFDAKGSNHDDSLTGASTGHDMAGSSTASKPSGMGAPSGTGCVSTSSKPSGMGASLI